MRNIIKSKSFLPFKKIFGFFKIENSGFQSRTPVFSGQKHKKRGVSELKSRREIEALRYITDSHTLMRRAFINDSLQHLSYNLLALGTRSFANMSLYMVAFRLVLC